MLTGLLGLLSHIDVVQKAVGSVSKSLSVLQLSETPMALMKQFGKTLPGQDLFQIQCCLGLTGHLILLAKTKQNKEMTRFDPRPAKKNLALNRPHLILMVNGLVLI